LKSLRARPRANAELDAVLLLKFEIIMRKCAWNSACTHWHPWQGVAPKPIFPSNKWSDLLSFFLPFFIVVATYITMVLGRDPNIEAALKSANASAKSMSKRGRRDTQPNPTQHPPPPPHPKKKKQKRTELKSKILAQELAQEKNLGPKIDAYPPTKTSSEEDTNLPSDDESANKSKKHLGRGVRST
jgi:hypothetical protein